MKETDMPTQRSSLRRAAGFGFAAATFLVGALAAASTPTLAQVGDPTLEVVPNSIRAGDVVQISGSNCPQTGPAPLAAPKYQVYLRFGPESGNSYSVFLSTAGIGVFTTQIDVRGEIRTAVEVEADGSWSTTMVVPADAVPGSNYIVEGVCATVLEPDPVEPTTLLDASVDRSWLSYGPLTVVEASEPPGTAPPAPVTPGQPQFTG